MTAGLSERIAVLSAEQFQSLADRLAAKKPGEKRASTLSRAVRPQRIPLSHSQEGVWFAERLGFAGTAYNLSVPLQLEGFLDVTALERSIASLVDRHESLRTRIEAGAQGDGYQLIDAHRDFKLETIDLSTLSATARTAEAERRLIEASSAAFDLANGPLFRACLLKLADQEHVLCWTVHHMIWDGWSIRIFIHDLLASYCAFSAGQPSPLVELETHYADYVLWQRQPPQVLAEQERLAYWKKQFARPVAALQLPSDRPRSKKVDFHNAHLQFSVSKELTAELRALSRKEGVTLYMLLLAVMQVLLSRWANQADVVVGSPAAGRTKQTENIIGFFSSMLPIRVDVSSTLSFRELLSRVNRTCLEAVAHQGIANEKLLAELQLDRRAARHPLYQVAFALHNFGTAAPQIGGIKLSLPQAQYATVGTELSMHLAEGADELSGWIAYASELFDESTIRRFADQYRTLLQAVLATPQQPIAQLSLLSEQERQRLVVQFNDTATSYPRDKPIHQLFEEQVRCAPDAPAIAHEGRQLSYRELNMQANQLARYLIGNGVAPGSSVAVCAERGPELIVAMLGILKAGSIYVPLDPGYPQQRLEYMLRDTTAQMILTQAHLRARLPDTAVATIALDTGWEAIAEEDGSDIDAASLGLASDPLAYVMYTSGSTGEPKGVMVPQRAVNRLVINNDYLQIDATDCIAFCSNPAFDASTFEVWAALLHGAKLLIVPQPVLFDATALAQLLEQQGVTVLHLTTALFNQHSAALANIFARLKALYFGGEAADPNMTRKVLQTSPPQQLVHLYGPTETTAFAAWNRIGSVAQDAKNISIGRPISNARIYILDDHRQPVPIGWVGEIYVGGEGVARGYLNRAELTAERFLTDPFSAQPHARMYRTGDLGRWLADGTIEFCGRNDQQVKIRGYRVELGEVEAHLSRDPRVKEAAVTPWGEGSERRLVGYVVEEASAEASSEEAVRRWQTLFEESYQEEQTDDAPSFAGWNSSYTGRALPEADMQEWLSATIDRIRELEPRKVLELGCGSGLLVEQLAPHCAAYRATDFSPNVVRRLQRWLQARPALRHVALAQATALDIDEAAASCDTIVLNSVVQYFPDMEYLVAVLERAVAALADGGKIFIGDVRHRGLLRAFHSSVQLSRAAGNLSAGQLKARIDRALQQEKELVIDPEFFRALQQHLPRISGIEVELKRGQADNELTRYRYDATLHIGRYSEPVPQQWLLWNGEKSDLPAQLSRFLTAHRPAGIRISGVRNARIAGDLLIVRKLEACEDDVEVAELREQLRAVEQGGIDPEEVCQLAESRGFRVRASWMRGAADGSLEFTLIDPGQSEYAVAAGTADTPVPSGPAWSCYAHEPLLEKQRQAAALARQLREQLDGELPEYMVPSAIVVMDELPLTPNGKLDRTRLPTPAFDASRAEPYAAPQGAVEEALAAVWQEILCVERIGRNDSFFELGGNSLLAIQVAGGANRLGLRIEGRQIIEHENIASLAAAIGPLARVVVASDEPELVPGEVPLTPLMRQIVTETEDSTLYDNIMVFRVECGRRLNQELVARSVRQLVMHHDALRIRFQPGQAEMRLWNAGVDAADDPELFDVADLSMLPPASQDAAIEEISAKLRRPADIAAIRMFRTVLIQRGDDLPQLLLMAAHHVIFDPFTQEILLDDLTHAYEQASRGREIRLGAKTTSFKRWAEHVSAQVASVAAQEQSYWRECLTAENVGLQRDEGPPEYFGIEVRLDVAETNALQRSVQRNCDASAEEVLLTALTHALARQTGQRKFAISLTRSGRDVPFGGIDVSRTVGWFSIEFPVVLDATRVCELGAAAVRSIREQVRGVPSSGMGYGMLRYNGTEDHLAGCPCPRIALNYLGNPGARPEGLFTITAVDADGFREDKIADPARNARLQVTAGIREGSLWIGFACDEQLMDRTMAEGLAEGAIQALRELIELEGNR